MCLYGFPFCSSPYLSLSLFSKHIRTLRVLEQSEVLGWLLFYLAPGRQRHSRHAAYPPHSGHGTSSRWASPNDPHRTGADDYPVSVCPAAQALWTAGSTRHFGGLGAERYTYDETREILNPPAPQLEEDPRQGGQLHRCQDFWDRELRDGMSVS